MPSSKLDARKRTEIFIRVQSGQMSATEAAEVLGISRKTYYKWEQRAFQALLDAMTDRSPGRPSTPSDPEKEALEKSVSEMERQLLMAEERAEIRDYFMPAQEVENLKRVRKALQKKRKSGKNRGTAHRSEDG